MSKCYDNPDYDDSESDIQNTWNQHPKIEQKHEAKVMKNIHILPTDKPSKLYVRNDVTPPFYSNFQGKPVNIYITSSDEEIKEGDWCMSLCDDESYDEIYQCKYIDLVDEEDKKIILTTDQDLIKDGVQAIDDEFLEWFVNNQSCEFVNIVPFDGYNTIKGSYFGYEIIIPKEEHKQETLEEAAERYFKKVSPNICFYDATRFGAKWQQERSYSEEDIKIAFEEGFYVHKYVTDNIYEAKECFNEWFNRFKKL